MCITESDLTKGAEGGDKSLDLYSAQTLDTQWMKPDESLWQTLVENPAEEFISMCAHEILMISVLHVLHASTHSRLRREDFEISAPTSSGIIPT